MALFSTNHTLTQGSLHYRLATLGYQKQNPDGVRQFANILCAALPFEMAIKNRRLWGSSICKHPLCLLFLLEWLSKAEGDGVRIFHKFCKKTLPEPPLSLERGWG